MSNEEILKKGLTDFKSKYPLTIGWRLKKHAKILLDDETIRYVFYAQKNKSSLDVTSTGIIAVTNKRLVIARDRVVFGYFFDSITPDLFNDLKVRSGIIWGKIIIDTVRELVILSNISKSALTEIEEEITSAMMELKDTVQVMK